MPFSNCQFTGMSLGAPDAVIVGPAVVAGPNTAPGAMNVPSQMKVFLNGAAPASNLMTMAPASIGPPGAGVVSGMGMGPVRHMMGSTAVFVAGSPITRLADPTQHNGMSPNIVGATIVPAQVKKMVLR